MFVTKGLDLPPGGKSESKQRAAAAALALAAVHGSAYAYMHGHCHLTQSAPPSRLHARLPVCAWHRQLIAPSNKYVSVKLSASA